MRSPMLVKLVVLSFLVLLFTVPLLFIGGLTAERRGYRDSAVLEIQRNSAGGQRLAGPFVVIPYRVRTWSEQIRAGESRPVRVPEIHEEKLVLLPDSLDVSASLELETRYRGIYRTQLFRTTTRLSGSFVLSAPRASVGEIVDWGPATLSMSVSDARGMRELPSVRWEGDALAPEPSTARTWMGSGFHAMPVMGSLGAEPRRARFEIDLPLLGTESFTVVPVGRQTRTSVRSSWPHPVFTGPYLPDARQISAQGFSAEWRLSRLATDIERLLAQSEQTGQDAMQGSAFGVDLLEPLDTYRLTDRALKYGLLFVVLTFAAFVLFEVLAGVQVHVVQYLLVGMALSLFFLLVLSLSEHIAYPIAYVVASGASIALITLYAAKVLIRVERAIWLALGLAALYAFLYVVMQSQDYALLLGSALSFTALAIVMWTTRGVDWNLIGAPGDRSKPS